MAVLVTGGAGFIGAEVVRELVARGEEPVHVTSHSGAVHRLADVADRIELHALDLADGAQITALIEQVRPRAIYHFGAILSAPGEADHQACIQTNAYGTHTLLESSRLNGVQQVIFASSLGVFAGTDMPRDVITDQSAQHPDIVYGATKVFGELLGRYYRRAHGLDFRGIRYPAIVGPGITTWSTAQYTSWTIEKCAQGEPFTIWAPEDYAITLLYYKEAGRAAVELAAAPAEAIKTVNYVIGGVAPTPTAGQIAELVRAKVPGAQIDFVPHPTLGHLFSNGSPRVEDSCARAEWGWSPQFDYPAMIDDMLVELQAGQ